MNRTQFHANRKCEGCREVVVRRTQSKCDPVPIVVRRLSFTGTKDFEEALLLHVHVQDLVQLPPQIATLLLSNKMKQCHCSEMRSNSHRTERETLIHT